MSKRIAAIELSKLGYSRSEIAKMVNSKRSTVGRWICDTKAGRVKATKSTT